MLLQRCIYHVLFFRDLHTGDNVVFYRCGTMYTGVITTIGIVNNVYQPRTLEEFKECCKRRTIFSDEELEQQWNYRKTKPFVVEFLYAYSFPTPKVNLKRLYDTGVFRGDFPRGFARLSKEQFESILQLTKTNIKYVVE